MGKTDTKLSDKEIKQIKKDMERIKKGLDAIEKMGGKIPKWLTKSLKALDLAIKAGSAIGEAAEQASKDLKRFTNDLKLACKDVDEEMRMVCEAKIDRQWQKRSVDFTLNYKNPNSVTSKLIDKVIKWITPDKICKYWDRCAKIDKK